MSGSLYEISSELALIHKELEENEGVLNDRLEQIFDACTLSFKDKCRNIGLWRLNLDGQAEALKREESRLAARRKAVENRSHRLKELVQTAMETAGIDKLDLDTVSFRLQTNPPSLDVWNEKEIPAKFIVVIPESKVVDRRAVMDALKKGEEVPGAILQKERKHLRQR